MIFCIPAATNTTENVHNRDPVRLSRQTETTSFLSMCFLSGYDSRTHTNNKKSLLFVREQNTEEVCSA